MTEEAQPTQKRIMPISELDLSLMTINSQWGQHEVSPALRSKLNKVIETKNQDGSSNFNIEELWDMLSFYTRDLRLANLSSWDGELNYCRYYLDLAHDLLLAEMIEPFLICISRVATVIETSQSKGGFLRRRINTFTQESINKDEEPPKKSLFGIGKKKEGGFN